MFWVGKRKKKHPWPHELIYCAIRILAVSQAFDFLHPVLEQSTSTKDVHPNAQLRSAGYIVCHRKSYVLPLYFICARRDFGKSRADNRLGSWNLQRSYEFEIIANFEFWSSSVLDSKASELQMKYYIQRIWTEIYIYEGQTPHHRVHGKRTYDYFAVKLSSVAARSSRFCAFFILSSWQPRPSAASLGKNTVGLRRHIQSEVLPYGSNWIDHCYGGDTHLWNGDGCCRNIWMRPKVPHDKPLGCIRHQL